MLLMENAVLRTDGQVSGWVSVSFSLDVYLVADLLMFEELQVYFQSDCTVLQCYYKPANI